VAEDIRFRLVSADPENVFIQSGNISVIGDMAPGDISFGDKVFEIVVSKRMQENGQHFYLEIESHEHVFWTEMFRVTNLEQEGNNKLLHFDLAQNFPNPFNPVTTITYQLPEYSAVTVTVYNITGQKVAVLQSAEKPAGVYELQWDASALPSGVYFCKLVARSKNGHFNKTRKLTILR
jgi:hypothetical protein